MASKRLLAAALPTEGKALVRADHEVDVANRGMVPYFVSGPLSRSGSIGYWGSILHVGCWIAAMVFDIVIMNLIDYNHTPGLHTLWMYGFVSLLVGMVSLLLITGYHACSRGEARIPEGGAPPFLMTLFIGGAMISLLFSVLQIVMVGGDGHESFYFHFDNTTSPYNTFNDKQHFQTALLELTGFSLMFKVYVVQFLRNNQEWAGPANELKKLSMKATAVKGDNNI